MGCSCVRPVAEACRLVCITVALAKHKVQKGGVANLEVSMSLLDELLASNFNETLDFALMTDTAEKLKDLGQLDAALVLSGSVTSSLTFIGGRLGSAVDVSLPMLQRNLDLQADILEEQGDPEIAAQLRETLTGPLGAAEQ